MVGGYLAYQENMNGNTRSASTDRVCSSGEESDGHVNCTARSAEDPYAVYDSVIPEVEERVFRKWLFGNAGVLNEIKARVQHQHK